MNATALLFELGIPPPEDINAHLEMSLIETYLKGKGFTYNELASQADESARHLLIEAITYASVRLAEIETRSNLVRALHDASG